MHANGLDGHQYIVNIKLIRFCLNHKHSYTCTSLIALNWVQYKIDRHAYEMTGTDKNAIDN